MNGQECVYMTVSEVKRYLNISQAAAYELTHRADFPVCRIGGSIRIPKSAFLAWVSSSDPFGMAGTSSPSYSPRSAHAALRR